MKSKLTEHLFSNGWTNNISVSKTLMSALSLVRMESTAIRVLVQQVTVDATVKQVSEPKLFPHSSQSLISILSDSKMFGQ